MKTRSLAIAAIAIVAAGCGSRAPASTPGTLTTATQPPSNVVSDAVGFFDHAKSVQGALGRTYACTVAPPGRVGAVLYLGSATLVEKARAIVAKSPFPRTLVEVGWTDRARYKLLPIMRALARASVRYPGASQVDFETAFQSCPRVQISLEPKAKVNAPLLAWAEDATRRYGADRVAISFSLAPRPAAAESGKST